MDKVTKEKEIIDHFHHYFPGNQENVRVFFAPGRVNLIGEHTDYNGGYVLPAALTMGTYMVICPRHDGKFVVRSNHFPGQTIHFSNENLTYGVEDDWGNYPKGIVKEFIDLGGELSGANIYYYGNIPNGAGLSSSASISMVTVYGLSKIVGLSLPIKKLVKLCQHMENHYIGVHTGIMDQFAVGFGQKDHALFLNCQTFEAEKVPLQLGDYRLVITNSNKPRGLADSKYNQRRRQCEKGLKDLQKMDLGLHVLGELTMERFLKRQSAIKDCTVLKRVRHVVSENQRVKQGRRLLKQGDLLAFGKCMIASHQSLRDDYEVTGAELDALFEAQKNVEGCIGTRMTGAGFGGCTVSIVHHSSIPQFEKEVQTAYKKKTGRTASFYHCQIGEGVNELKKSEYGAAKCKEAK